MPRPAARSRSALLGDARLLPRPWEPASCRAPQLREQLWLWLDAVVAWLVTEYVWEATDTIPACWPQHPHLVHEIAVLADQRRRAGHAFTSDVWEEWHRYSLPAFTERMKSRLRQPLRGGPSTVAGEWPPHPVRGRDQPPHPGEPLSGGRRCFETNRGERSASARGWDWSILTRARSTISRARRSRRPWPGSHQQPGLERETGRDADSLPTPDRSVVRQLIIDAPHEAGELIVVGRPSRARSPVMALARPSTS